MTSIRARFAAIATAIIIAVSGATTASAANIVETAQSAGKFNTLIAAAKAAGLVPALTGPGPLTVFAPTDDAFAELGDDAINDLLKPENKQKLTSILTYHVLGRQLTSNQLPHKSIPVKPLNQSAKLRVEKTAGGVTVNNANVITADVKADNGVIHIIDRVLIP
ncbi:MAG: fasciclin domain-containing protein [Pseudomonadota bacterium]